MHVDVFAKVNLVLRVRAPDRTGLHTLRSLAQSVDWRDCVVLEDAEEDVIEVDAADVPADETNLAWRAVEAVRRAADARGAVRVSLAKRIPTAAGLGGGSADAAGGLVLAAGRFGLDPALRDGLAPELGGDVAFCLRGGTAWMEGRGERLTAARVAADYVLGVVVPPFALATASVYRRWDELDGPTGPGIEGRGLPVSLRDLGPLVNDLVPAAVDLAPELGDWMVDLSGAWGRPVAMSGSGPALFGFFGEATEAADALGTVTGARSMRVCGPVDRGWEREPSGTLP